MTIRELLDRVLPSSPAYDANFAKKFRALVKGVVNDRERATAARPGNYRAAKKFFDSWMKLLDLFADDPRSLAALTAPKVRIEGAPRCGSMEDLFPETVLGTPTTLKLFLYFLEAEPYPAELGTKRVTKGSATATGKTKTSKKR